MRETRLEPRPWEVNGCIKIATNAASKNRAMGSGLRQDAISKMAAAEPVAAFQKPPQRGVSQRETVFSKGREISVAVIDNQFGATGVPSA
jgi:hypothetical protein